MTIYCNEMSNLSTTNPSAYEELKNGAFAVQRSDSTAFSCIPVDQSIELSMNRDAKVHDGPVGFSLNQALFIGGL